MMAKKPEVVHIESVETTGKTGYSEPVEYLPETLSRNVVADEGIPPGKDPLHPEYTYPIDAVMETGQ